MIIMNEVKRDVKNQLSAIGVGSIAATPAWDNLTGQKQLTSRYDDVRTWHTVDEFMKNDKLFQELSNILTATLKVPAKYMRIQTTALTSSVFDKIINQMMEDDEEIELETTRKEEKDGSITTIIVRYNALMGIAVVNLSNDQHFDASCCVIKSRINR